MVGGVEEKQRRREGNVSERSAFSFVERTKAGATYTILLKLLNGVPPSPLAPGLSAPLSPLAPGKRIGPPSNPSELPLLAASPPPGPPPSLPPIALSFIPGPGRRRAMPPAPATGRPPTGEGPAEVVRPGMVGPEEVAVEGRKVRDGEAVVLLGVLVPVAGGVAAREPEVIC